MKRPKINNKITEHSFLWSSAYLLGESLTDLFHKQKFDRILRTDSTTIESINTNQMVIVIHQV